LILKQQKIRSVFVFLSFLSHFQFSQTLFYILQSKAIINLNLKK
jgi:hypothetical protein